MRDFVVLGTDTDAGKTTFALLWLALFRQRYAYWKPVETGPSDSERVRQLVPGAQVLPPLRHFPHPVAPPLAARLQGQTIPAAADLARNRPSHSGPLLIETFGSPLSPLNEDELQIRLLQQLGLPTVLVCSSAVGAIGRSLQCLRALSCHNLLPSALVLLGAADDYAAQQIIRHGPVSQVFQLRPPASWDVEGIARASREQQQALTALAATLAPPSQPAEELLELDRRLVWHPYTPLRDPDPPLVSVAAQGEYLWLADGRRLIDGISSWWTILHGHRHPVLMAALARAATEFDHVQFAGVTHRPAVDLAQRLLRTAPWSGGRVFYSDNGSTAVEVALKMAYQFWCHQGEPQRTRFIGFANGYHGDTFGAMAVSRDPVFFGRFEPLLLQADIIPLAVEALEAALSRWAGRIAAVIVEPLVQGAGGMRMHAPATLRALAELAAQHNVLLIVDEVMTGGGRTGTLWAYQQAGIVPDLICAAKGLTGGVLPLAATLVAPRVVAAFDTEERQRTFFHGHSFTAHPLACAVAEANWQLLPPGPNPTARRMADFWERELGHLRELPHVVDVRICGCIAAVEVRAEGGYLAAVGRQMRRTCLEQGVLLRPLGSVLYTLPPLGTSDEALAQIAAAMKAAVHAVGPHAS